MNFVRYDNSNGYLTSVGYMPSEYIQDEINAGKPTMFVDQQIYDFTLWKVDLTTMQVVPKTPEELAASQPSSPPTAPLPSLPSAPAAPTAPPPQGE